MNVLIWARALNKFVFRIASAALLIVVVMTATVWIITQDVESLRPTAALSMLVLLTGIIELANLAYHTFRGRFQA